MTSPAGGTVVVSPVFVNGTAIMRAFGRRGFRCVAVSSQPDAVGFSSRFAAEKVHLPELRRRGPFADWLLSREDLEGALVIPTGDEIIAELDARRGELEGRFRLCIPDSESCRVALDKAALSAAAREAGIAVPLESPEPEPGAAAPRDPAFPLLVKPRYTIDFQRAFSSKMALAESGTELDDILRRCGRHGIGVVLQERLPDGSKIAAYSAYVRRDGEIAGDYTALRLGTYPPPFGTGFMEIARPIRPVLELGRRLVRHLGYSGAPLNLDVARDSRDGTWRLLDLNARSWRQVSLARRCGLDVVSEIISDYFGEPRPPLSRRGWGHGWLYIKDALLVKRGFPDRSPSLGDYLRLLRTRPTFGLLDRDDPRPFIEDIRPLLERRLPRIARSSGGQ